MKESKIPGTSAIDLVKIPESLETVPQKYQDDSLMGFDQQIETLKAAAEAVKPETEEERRKRERQEKSKKIVSAVMDGTSALANLFFTTQYAPNSYNPQHSALTKTNDRIEALKAERKANEDRYNNFMLKLGDVQNAKAKTLREMQAQQEAQKLAREKDLRDAEVHAWQAALQPDKEREQKGKADKAVYEAGSSYLELGNKPKELELKNATEIARANSYNASAANSYASANEHNRKYQKEFYGTDRNGKVLLFSDEKAAIDFERMEGTYEPSKWGHDAINETTVKDSSSGKTTTSKTTYPTKKGPGYGDKSKGAGY